MKKQEYIVNVLPHEQSYSVLKCLYDDFTYSIYPLVKQKPEHKYQMAKFLPFFFFALRSKTEEPISTFGSVDIYFIFRIFYKWVLFKPFTNHMKYFHLFAKIWQFAVVVGIVVGSLLTISTITMFIHTHTHEIYYRARHIARKRFIHTVFHVSHKLLLTRNMCKSLSTYTNWKIVDFNSG